MKHANEWMAFPRFVAVRFFERHGLDFPSGLRVEVIDVLQPPVPNNLTIKPRGQRRVGLTDFVRQIRLAADSCEA